MKVLKPVPLTADKFKPYGDVIELGSNEAISINGGNCLRYSDLAGLDMDESGVAGISLFDAKAYASPYQLNYVERHPLGSQAFIPMSTGHYLVVVADDIDGIAQQPMVFLATEKQGVNYARNVWHGVLSPIAAQSLFAVVDYIGDKPNLEESEFETPYLIEFDEHEQNES